MSKLLCTASCFHANNRNYFQNLTPTPKYYQNTMPCKHRHLQLQDYTRRLPRAEHEAEVGCCGTLKMMYYVNYAA